MKEISHIEGKYSSEVDVAVLLIFFTRVEITIRTFEQIRKARPSRLYLYQDGPRSGRKDDIENIAKCRKSIESMIDWELLLRMMMRCLFLFSVFVKNFLTDMKMIRVSILYVE